MPLLSEQYNGSLVLAIKGAFSSSEAAAIDAALHEAAVQKNVVIDLEHCRFLTSRALEAMLKALQSCEERGGRLIVAGMDDVCRKILQITRLDHRFESSADLATALRAMA